jgi:hypothetical protein
MERERTAVAKTVHPRLCLDAPLAEQARNRDHDSSDEYEQARKQHNVPQEHTHARGSPSSPLCGAILVSQNSAATGSAAVAIDMRDALLSFRAGGVPSGPPAIWSYLIGRRRIDYTLYLNSGLSQPR